MIPLTPAHMRALLVLCQFGMALLAVFYLRRRQLALTEYIKWGFFAFLIPFFGPFLTVYLHPGSVRDPQTYPNLLIQFPFRRPRFSRLFHDIFKEYKNRR